MWRCGRIIEIRKGCRGDHYEKPTGPGIVVTFTPDEVIVEYSNA